MSKVKTKARSLLCEKTAMSNFFWLVSLFTVWYLSVSLTIHYVLTFIICQKHKSQQKGYLHIGYIVVFIAKSLPTVHFKTSLL
jgi:hypothetical protein